MKKARNDQFTLTEFDRHISSEQIFSKHDTRTPIMHVFIQFLLSKNIVAQEILHFNR